MTGGSTDLGTQPTSLYRFFDADDVLLYVGITNCLPRRLMRHEDEKPWFEQVARVAVEQNPDRATALAAEKRAIETEHPRFNVRHNGHRASTSRRRSRGAKPVGRWTFEGHDSGLARTSDLWLYPELNCSSMVDDYYDYDGEEQLDEYVRYIRHRYPHYWEQDAVPIYWTVCGDAILEASPFQATDWIAQDFLTFFTWPRDTETDEPIDWYRLPVVNDRFPEFAQALGWSPSPLQATCPLRSIMDSRRGFWNPGARVERLSRALGQVG